MRCCIDNERGQATVEAAFLLPVFLMVLGLMVQPALMLYTRCVMYAAAAEGCRMLETKTVDDAAAKAFIVRRLKMVPNADAFHMGATSGWQIEMTGGGGIGDVSVKIVNKMRPLPLLGIAAGLYADRQQDGSLRQEVSVDGRLWPQWAQAAGTGPGSLAGAWK